MKNYKVLKPFNNGKGGLVPGDTVSLDHNRAIKLQAMRMVGAAISITETPKTPKTPETAVKAAPNKEKHNKRSKKSKK